MAHKVLITIIYLFYFKYLFSCSFGGHLLSEMGIGKDAGGCMMLTCNILVGLRRQFLRGEGEILVC